MFSVAAYYQNGDFNGADTYLNAVTDQHLTVQGKDIRTIDGINNLIAEAMATAAATRSYARVETPSIRTLANQDIYNLNGAVSNVNDTLIQRHEDFPRKLDNDESINFLVNTDDAAVQDHYGLIWLSDGPLQPVTGNMFTVRATAAITQTVSGWTLGALTFSQKLPVDNYKVVGMHVFAASGLAARLVFPGGKWRPGTFVGNNTAAPGFAALRYGLWGVWGVFNTNQPPQLEVLGGAATAQTVYLDLIRGS